MNVDGVFYVNAELQSLVFSELEQFCRANARQGFLPALKQIGNVAGLPGMVRHSIGLPDVHSGYGFAIGNVAAGDPNAVVSPGGVGFDINCGVRLLRPTSPRPTCSRCASSWRRVYSTTFRLASARRA